VSDSDPVPDPDPDPDPDHSPALEAIRYADGTLSSPGHDRSPSGAEPVGTVDLADRTGTVVTWTTSTATPPGVREPNHLAIVEFEVTDGGDATAVRVVGQLVTGDVAIGDEVRPRYVAELRDPEAGIRDPESQAWDGFRFEPVD